MKEILSNALRELSRFASVLAVVSKAGLEVLELYKD